MRKERKHYAGEEKVAILRRHLLDKVPVSDLCDELGLQPTGFFGVFFQGHRTEAFRILSWRACELAVSAVTVPASRVSEGYELVGGKNPP
jgi:transposase